MSKVVGGCLCGKIRYTSTAEPVMTAVCHCKNCQKASGAGGSVNAMIKSADFKLLQGKPKRYTAVADSGRTLHRHFCGDCGSPIYSQREQTPENMVVRAGTFDNAGDMKISHNIWTKSKRPWAHVDPASTQHPSQPDAPAR